MYASIVVGTDGSDTAVRAVDAAAELARRFGARLHVVSAYRSAPVVLAGAGPRRILESVPNGISQRAGTAVLIVKTTV